MDVEESMREILQAESQAILNIPVTEAYEAAVAAIVERVHHRGGKLVTAGMGKAGQIAMNIATTFSSTGTPAIKPASLRSSAWRFRSGSAQRYSTSDFKQRQDSRNHRTYRPVARPLCRYTTDCDNRHPR